MGLLAQRIALKYAVIVNKAALDQWAKDLRVMTKIYRSIPVNLEWDAPDSDKAKAREIWDEARKLFRQFKENFEGWVYRVVLPKRDKGEETSLEVQIRKSTWDFLYTIDAGTFLFPTIRPSTEPNYGELRQKRDGNIKRYQVSATKAFKDLAEYLDTKGGQLDRHEKIEHFEVSGVKVVVENWGRDEDNEGDFHFAMSQLGKWVGWIDRAGFRGACRGLTVTMNFEGREALTCGRYNPAKDALTLYPLGIAGHGDDAGSTFVHEVGHRFYFRDLPGQARAHWDAVLEARGVKISKDDVHRFSRAILGYDRPQELLGDDDRFRVALKEAVDLTDEVKFKELAKIPLKPWSAKTFEPDQYIGRLEDRVGETVQIEEITDYANTDTMEAYAECFREWVLRGPRALGPWTREFFGKVSRTGGARLAWCIVPR